MPVAQRPFPSARRALLFGIGFGAVNPDSTPIAGQQVSGATTLKSAVVFTVGGKTAALAYGGLAPGQVGLYQFNFTVPVDAPNGDVPLEATQAGEPIQQTLFLSVQAN